MAMRLIRPRRRRARLTDRLLPALVAHAAASPNATPALPPWRRSGEEKRTNGNGSAELFRAWVVRTVGHGQRYLIARRYLKDGRVMQSARASPTDDPSPEVEVQRNADPPDVTLGRLDAGWMWSPSSSRSRRAVEFLGRVVSLVALGTFLVVPRVGYLLAAVSIVLGVTEVAMSVVDRRSMRLVALLAAILLTWTGSDVIVRGCGVFLAFLAIWFPVGRTSPRPRR